MGQACQVPRMAAVLNPGPEATATPVAPWWGGSSWVRSRTRRIDTPPRLPCLLYTSDAADEGNLGGPSVLRVLERTHDDPPHNGAHGVLVAYGPGFNTAAIRGTWHA